MNLIQKIRDYFFKPLPRTNADCAEGEVCVGNRCVKESPIIHPPHDEEEERRAIIAQRQEDNKWFIRIVQKATERYVSIYVNKDAIPVIDCTRYNDTYTVYHERSAMYKDGIEAAIERELQWMLKKASKVPKGTVPSV